MTSSNHAVTGPHSDYPAIGAVAPDKRPMGLYEASIHEELYGEVEALPVPVEEVETERDEHHDRFLSPASPKLSWRCEERPYSGENSTISIPVRFLSR